MIDAETIDLPEASVDAVACRMGYMLMADPAAALRETARVLAPDGRIALAVRSDPGSNPWAAVAMQAVASQLAAPPAAADAPSLWALADEARQKVFQKEGYDLESVDGVVEDWRPWRCRHDSRSMTSCGSRSSH